MDSDHTPKIPGNRDAKVANARENVVKMFITTRIQCCLVK